MFPFKRLFIPHMGTLKGCRQSKEPDGINYSITLIYLSAFPRLVLISLSRWAVKRIWDVSEGGGEDTERERERGIGCVCLVLSQGKYPSFAARFDLHFSRLINDLQTQKRKQEGNSSDSSPPWSSHILRWNGQMCLCVVHASSNWYREKFAWEDVGLAELRHHRKELKHSSSHCKI